MISKDEIREMTAHFSVHGELAEIRTVNDGIINNTFAAVFTDGEKYIFQNINVNVFKNPDELMENISGITTFLRNKITEAGGNPDRETLTFIPCDSGKYYFLDSQGRYWRMYRYHDDAHTYSNVDEPEIMYSAGSAFGKFQSLLSDYPIETLHDTIPDFHNTAKRFETLKKSIAENRSGRADSCREDIEFALSQEETAKKLVSMLEKGELPLRVTHNDTKVNNVLFDNQTNEAFCVIDLDTVMPGLSLYDFGDAMRSGAANIIEDSPEYDKVGIRTDLYEAYVRGYLSTAASSLTENEVGLLAFSAKLLTYECGIRFLTDYLDGDVYFKTEYSEHNIVRARNQFAMVRDIERKMPVLEEITGRAYAEALGR